MMRFLKKRLFPVVIQIDSGCATHTGRVRTLNEDSLTCIDLPLIDITGKLCALADGLGGYEGGEIASKRAIDALVRSLTEVINGWSRDENELIANTGSTIDVLIEAVRTANTEVHGLSQSTGKRMATTIAAALLMGSRAFLANVGDSRIYSLHGDTLRQVTTDHSLVAGLVASGAITKDEIYTHPQRNMVTRCLGVDANVEADTFIDDLKPGDALLICSDGLWEMVRDDQIKNIMLESENAQAACDRLIEEANNNGGTDNISVIIVKVQDRKWKGVL